MMNTKDSRPIRRRRTDEEKQRIVEETMVGGTSVSIVARRHNVNANQVFARKRQYRDGVLGSSKAETTLVPVGVIDGDGNVTPLTGRPKRKSARLLSASSIPQNSLEPCRDVESASPAVLPRHPGLTKHSPMIEVELRSGSRIRIDAGVRGVALQQMLKLIRGLA